VIAVWVLAGFVGGLLVNYLADVLPRTRRLSAPIWWPISRNLIFSYLSKARVLVVFLFSLVVAIVVFQSPPPNFSIILFACILAYFLLVTIIDIEHRAVLHPVSLAGALLLGGIGIWRHGLISTLIGGLAGFAILLAFYFVGDWLGRLMAKRRGEKWQDTALGFGDVNLAGVIGLLLGWPGVVAALFGGMLAAGLLSAAYLLWMMVGRRYTAFTSIPYAPFLCFGAVLMFSMGIYLSSSI